MRLCVLETGELWSACRPWTDLFLLVRSKHRRHAPGDTGESHAFALEYSMAAVHRVDGDITSHWLKRISRQEQDGFCTTG